LAKLRQLQLDSEPDLVTELIDLFLADSTVRLEILRQSVAQEHPSELIQPAHSLKGASANLGANAFSALCLELEKLGQAQTIAGASDLLVQLEVAYSQLCLALKAVRKA
jgi:HPt (histidine-containing phosphotransfer) domain-containing protein